jgi:hypothetical protein
VTGTVNCALGQQCTLKVCYYSQDRAGNSEAIKTSNTFIFGPRVCDGKACGEACFGVSGICDGPSPTGSCYSSGGCTLNCSVPSPGAGNERIWIIPSCSRTGSIKCGPASVCGNSYYSCTTGGVSTPVTGDFVAIGYPTGSYKTGQTYQLTVGGLSSNPTAFRILTECSVTRPDGTIIYFDNWGYDTSFAYPIINFFYTFRPTDPEGIWTVNYCGLYSDFETNSGWALKINSTPRTFVLDNSPPSIIINNPKANDVYAADFLVNATVGDPAYSSPPGTEFVYITPSQASVGIGEIKHFDSYYGTNLATSSSCWRSSNDAIAKPTEQSWNPSLGAYCGYTGNIKGNSEGSVTISAMISGIIANAQLTVSANSIAFRWENASSSGSWTTMSSNGGYYTANFNVGLVSDGSYSFRVKANDSVGNSNETIVSNVQIDRRPPDITILSPAPVWYRSDFDVKASVTDNRGLNSVRYRWENSTGNGQWNPMVLAADGNYTATFAVASVVSGNYTIRVWANDSLGNAADKTAGAGIDYVSPSSYMTKPIAGSFILTPVFNISWTGSDALSGVRCNYVVYRFLNGAGQYSGEYNVKFPGGNCTSLAQYEFNPAIEQPAISDVNNFTFFFRSIALDNAGNLESKAAWETNATIYIPKLVTFYAVEKVSGIIVRNGGKVANNRTVVVSVKAKDVVPGNFDITVYFNSHAPGTSSPQQLSAWNSFTCPSIRECNVSIDTITGESEDIRQVDYAILATTADSSELLPPSAPSSYFYYLVYRHPICNFLVNDIFRTTLGSGELISIEVRNFYNQFGMVGLKFDSGMARFLENGQQYIQIPLNPMEEKIIYARLIPPPPSQEGLPLIMTGNTTADYLLQDEDSITIIVGLPADFSELSNIAAVVVVALALIVFLKLAKA